MVYFRYTYLQDLPIWLTLAFIYNTTMSLSSFFQKRGKQQGTSQSLTTLFSQKQSSKFKELKQDPEPNTAIFLPPEPKPDEPQNLQATIFVGNIPISLKHKDLKQMFKECGKIEKVWFRSVPVEQNKLGKKANFILGKYQEDADSMNGYVRFSEKQDAEKACKLNGTVIQDHTLRVFLCLDDNMDYETTIFVGNLPLDVKEEQLRKHFAPTGEIINVRVIKDKFTFKGIGIGYVRFANKADMFKAIQTMNGTPLRERPLRVKRAIEKSKLEKKFNKVQAKKMSQKGYTPPQGGKVFGKDKPRWKQNPASNSTLIDPQEQQRQNARKFHFKRKMIKK